METIRVGLVGTGFAGKFHLEALERLHGVKVELAAVTSLRPESREAFGAAHGIPVYENAEAMLGAIDLIDICSPPSAHHEAILAAAASGKHIVCEKPLTGWFGPPGADESFRGDSVAKAQMLDGVVERLAAIAKAVKRGKGIFGYAENFVYAPSVQKEREIIEKSGAQILRMIGEESHNGSHSPVYGIWRFQGGGSLIGKGCHPLTGLLYLKRVEGLARDGAPIRPARVTARTHRITQLPGYRDAGHIRTTYHDTEDYGFMHVIFEDGTVGDVVTSELVLGGIYDYIEVFANNHRTRCHMSPAHLMDTYNPRAEQFENIYLVEKASTKEGWSPAAPDESFTLGYQAEMQDFLSCAARGEQPQSCLELAFDTTTTIYAAYVSQERKGAEVAVPRI
ncbi:MAG: Gfo/Idh/MocA family oxidoreductase [Kiritimatiellae bacterium]|nr:Gfo/Idh/MocA family oxidoreductase [Kiritimatiellia bacterium]